MKKIFLATLFSLGFSMNAFAVLPPFYESLVEISSILKDQRLAEKLNSGEGITEIKKNEDGFLITTTHYQIQVNVKYKPQARPGPAQFDLEFQEPVALESNKT